MKNTRRTAPVRVFIVEQNYLTRLGLIIALSEDPNVEFGGHAETEEDLSAIDALAADVIIVNDKGDSVGLEACRKVRYEHPKAGIILLTSESNCAVMLQAISAGANACCLITSPPERLRAAILGVRHGDLWVDSQVAWVLIDKFRGLGVSQFKSPPVRVDADCVSKSTDLLDDSVSLTTRESEVLKLIVHGQKNQDIAASLRISLGTAKAHVRSILSKLGVDHRTQAAVEAMRRGLM